MSLTVTDICNMALRHIGARTITAIDADASQEDRDCNVYYEQCRDTVLRDYPWPFAAKRDAMTEVTIDSSTHEDYYGLYDYAYSFPSDCLKPRQVFEAETYYDKPFEIMRLEDDTKVILTDAEDAILFYTMAVTDVTWFDTQFVNALALCLASKIARPLTKSAQLAERLDMEYRQAIREAEASANAEHRPVKKPTVPWIDARYE